MMRAVIWEAPGQLTITEAADPAPQHGELIIQVGICGICGTDLHIADGEFPPHAVPDHPGPRVRGPDRGPRRRGSRRLARGCAGRRGSLAVLRALPGLPQRAREPLRELERVLSPPFALDRFAEALASVRRGEGIKLQVAPAA
jgi:hypothetical protein